jgi:hypothetical protein
MQWLDEIKSDSQRVAFSLRNVIFDLPHHRRQSTHDLIILKPNHPPSHLTQHLLPPFIFLFLQVVDIAIHFSPHPTSPKYDEIKAKCGFKVHIVVFGGGAEGGGVTIKIDDESLNTCMIYKANHTQVQV